jgi:hypothetical protein
MVSLYPVDENFVSWHTTLNNPSSGECHEAYPIIIQSAVFAKQGCSSLDFGTVSHLLSDAIDGYFCDRPTVSDMVVKASITGKAIEGTCNSFEDAPSGATLRAYACRGEAHQGTTWFYRVATVYVVHRQIPYTLGVHV